MFPSSRAPDVESRKRRRKRRKYLNRNECDIGRDTMNNDLAQWRSRIATGRELHRLNYLLAMTRMSDFAISRSGARDFSFFFCREIG